MTGAPQEASTLLEKLLPKARKAAGAINSATGKAKDGADQATKFQEQREKDRVRREKVSAAKATKLAKIALEKEVEKLKKETKELSEKLATEKLSKRVTATDVSASSKARARKEHKDYLMHIAGAACLCVCSMLFLIGPKGGGLSMNDAVIAVLPLVILFYSLSHGGFVMHLQVAP